MEISSCITGIAEEYYYTVPPKQLICSLLPHKIDTSHANVASAGIAGVIG